MRVCEGSTLLKSCTLKLVGLSLLDGGKEMVSYPGSYGYSCTHSSFRSSKGQSRWNFPKGLVTLGVFLDFPQQ